MKNKTNIATILIDPNHPGHLAAKQSILKRLKKDTVEVSPLPGKPVTSACWVPKNCVISSDGQPDILRKYTHLKLDGISFGAHVIAAAYQWGRYAEPGEQVLHDCDRKCCRNPQHLRIGSGKENVADAIERRLMIPGFKCALQGEKSGRAKLSNRDAAELKWLGGNTAFWFHPAIADHHSEDEALAIFFHCTVAVVKRTKRVESWTNVEPVRPQKLPDAKSVPPNAIPAPPDSEGPMAKFVEEIRVGYMKSADKKHYVSNAAKQYSCSGTTIRDILKGKTYSQIRPELTPVDFSKVGNIEFPVRTVQAIRATRDANPHVKGLLAAMARHFDCNLTHVGHIADRLYRSDVPDDPSAAIPLRELPFKILIQRGANHRLSKLTDNQVVEILRALHAGEKVRKLAMKYKVSIQTIYKIRDGKSYPLAQARFRAERAESGESNA